MERSDLAVLDAEVSLFTRQQQAYLWSPRNACSKRQLFAVLLGFLSPGLGSTCIADSSCRAGGVDEIDIQPCYSKLEKKV